MMVHGCNNITEYYKYGVMMTIQGYNNIIDKNFAN